MKYLILLIKIAATITGGLVAAAALDILMALLLSEGMIMSVTCFSATSVFAALLCCQAGWSKRYHHPKIMALLLLITIIAIAALLFILVAPLSGNEYRVPVKSFALVLVSTTLIVWCGKFYSKEDQLRLSAEKDALHNYFKYD